MNTDIIRSQITSGFWTQSPANICYKTRPYSPKKAQASTQLSTDYQTNKQMHPFVKFTIKISILTLKIKKINITSGYTSWLHRKTKEMLTAKLMKLQSINE